MPTHGGAGEEEQSNFTASVSGGGSNNPPVVVSIDLHAIYNKLVAVENCVRTIQTTMAAQDHERRLRSVERRAWQMPTLAGLVAIGALIVSVTSLVNGGG